MLWKYDHCVTVKLTGFTGVDGTGTAAGLSSLLGFSGGFASAISLVDCTACEVAGCAVDDLTGETPSGMLIGTGVQLWSAGSLLLLRCLLFLLKTRPTSVLRLCDLTSTCCSTRTLYHL